MDAKMTVAAQARLATSTTFRCVLGYGIGQLVGVIIAKAFEFSNSNMVLLSLLLGLVYGLDQGVQPLLRAGMSYWKASWQVLAAEGMAAVAMEVTEVVVEEFIPAVVNGGLERPGFWGGLLVALMAGFLVAWPVNYFLLGHARILR